MALQDEFNETMLALYWRIGRETGYWAHYFLRTVCSKGGLATAQGLLKPRRNKPAGLTAIIKSGRPDITVEALVLDERFSDMFTPEELAEARRRLGRFGTT